MNFRKPEHPSTSSGNDIIVVLLLKGDRGSHYTAFIKRFDPSTGSGQDGSTSVVVSKDAFSGALEKGATKSGSSNHNSISRSSSSATKHLIALSLFDPQLKGSQGIALPQLCRGLVQ